MDGISDFIADLGSKQNWNPAPDILEHDSEGRSPVSTPAFYPLRRDKAGLRQRTFAEAVATLSETSWKDFSVTGLRTFQWCVGFILTHCTSPEARH